MRRFAALLLLHAFVPRPAEACGGLFCEPNAPVVQTGEQILFSVDRAAGTVDAIINIQYAGPAEDFAWVLPLQSAPIGIEVGPQSAFQVIDQITAPRFDLRFETDGVCRGGGFRDSDDAAFAGAPESDRSGVVVLARKEVGPYDSVVIQGEDPEAMRRWLVDNGYGVTDEMMRMVVPYVQKGDALLSLKLRKDNEVGDIQPLHVTMRGDEVCVPIRLTAIAAVDDMDITVTVLSDEGRAVPENFFEVELNLARIDWLRRGANYREIVAEAADEGQGHAFTTEFAGSARAFDERIFPARGYDRAGIERAASFSRLLDALSGQGLIQKPGLGPILRRAAQGELAARLDADAEQFDRCVACFFGTDGQVDSRSFAAELWDRIVEPEQRTQALFDGKSYATRLYTLMSPDEMTIDPEFAFRADLPDVSNQHVATLVSECGFGGGVVREYIRIQETGQRVPVDLDPVTRASMPAAARVRQLAQDLEVQDNRPLIERTLSGVTAGGCAGLPGRGEAGLLLFLLCAGFAFRRR